MTKSVIILSILALISIESNEILGQSLVRQAKFTLMLSDEEQKSEQWQERISEVYNLEHFSFELVSSKTEDDFSPSYICVQVFEKPSNRFVQEIDLRECDFCHGCSPFFKGGDFNFDGREDFQLFTCYYAGANTSSLYYLYDPERKEFFDSGFDGTSLEFDQSNQTIFEHNQCCAGSRVSTAIYKVIDNKMVLIERHCYAADEQKMSEENEDFELEEVPCDEGDW
jgi:hypothetical protein